MRNTFEIYLNEETGLPFSSPVRPSDTFDYKDSAERIHMDIDIFEQWEEGKITTKTAAEYFSKQKALGFNKVTNKDFIMNANWLGYFRTLAIAEK